MDEVSSNNKVSLVGVVSAHAADKMFRPKAPANTPWLQRRRFSPPIFVCASLMMAVSLSA